MAEELDSKAVVSQNKEENKKVSRSEALMRVIRAKPNSYEIDDAFIPASSIDDAHTTQELVYYAENDKKVDIEARILCATADGLKYKKLDKKQFIEACKSSRASEVQFKESFDDDFQGSSSVGNALVGNDYIPLLGGPFNKQLYMTDYLRQHATAFHASTHDPVAKRIINIVRQFTLGKGYRIEVTGGKDEDLASGLIKAAEKQNKLHELMHYVCTELSIYGEVMVWKLPRGQQSVQYQLRPGQELPKVLIPRYRLIDPSTIWEVVTYPEDISRVLYYQQVAPTQYQIYTAPDVPSLKFMVQQIPGDQVFHFKTNTVSNEKRGRSDLFPILGYLKRLRDAVNYQIIADQKNSAWAIDTSIEGSQTDIDAYIDAQNQIGPIAPAGSEFVHTSKVTRQYLANQGSKGGASNSFEWALNMVAAGSGIPVSYFGTHISAGSTRASALVGTEPVAKMMEERQLLLENIIRAIIDDLLEYFGLDAKYEVIWPEIITQDRSAKLKDIELAEMSKWISPRRAATSAAKELGFNDYDFEAEQSDIEAQKTFEPELTSPLTNPNGNMNGNGMGAQPGDRTNKPSAVTSDDKRSLKQNMGF